MSTMIATSAWYVWGWLIFCAVAVCVGWIWELAQRERRREERWQRWLKKDLPALEPQVNWDDFEKRLQKQLYGDPWKRVEVWQILSAASKPRPTKELVATRRKCPYCWEYGGYVCPRHES